jgi:hypothetical protein
MVKCACTEFYQIGPELLIASTFPAKGKPAAAPPSPGVPSRD